MGTAQGFSKAQVSFQLLSLDEMIDSENPIRAIDAFVESLCLLEMEIKEYKKYNRGQQPYASKGLLKLLIYGEAKKYETEKLTFRRLCYDWIQPQMNQLLLRGRGFTTIYVTNIFRDISQ